ncbi:MAG: CapA family protein [Lachnospiraceae bacterium]|nr:CapA family protein [Lachnospiraceae bacterium]
MKKIILQLPLVLALCVGIIYSAHLLNEKDKQNVAKYSYDYESKKLSKNVATNTAANANLNKETVTENITEVVTEEPTTDDSFEIKLSFVGDCLCATNENTHYENCFNDVADRKDKSYFLAKVNKYFLNDDFTISDCENVYSDSKDLQVSDKGQYQDPNIEAYWFKSKAKNAEILSAGGIDCVSISNNHINDYGSQGKNDTKDALDKAGVLWGEEGKTVYYEKNGFKIAVICVSMYGDGVVPNIIDYIKKATKKSDYQIIYFHGGTEAIHEPETWKKNACHKLVDAGADLIMGDHPHVLQPLEVYNDVTIIYSLGNFIFGGNRHPENRTIIYQHTLTITKDSLSSQSGKIIPCYVYTGDTNNWQPAVIKDKGTRKKVLKFMKWEADSPL